MFTSTSTRSNILYIKLVCMHDTVTCKIVADYIALYIIKFNPTLHISRRSSVGNAFEM